MATQQLMDGANLSGEKQSEIHSASTSCGGLDGELSISTDMMGDYFREADPILLARAICLVYDRWIKSNRKPGSDNKLHCTRTHRPALVAEITSEWEVLSGESHDDDLFPYHESYVIRKWIDFRKMSDPKKQAWIAASKYDE